LKVKAKPSAWVNLREHVRYRVDQIFSGGSFAQLALLTVVTAVSILFGMSAWFFGLFDQRNANIAGIGRQLDAGVLDTLWWSAKHVFDPSFFDLNYGATWPVVVISLVMSVLGMGLFATLLGFISNGIEGYVQVLRKGNSVVKETGHVLILGWNEKVFSMLDLLEDRAQDLKVVVLSQHSLEQMNELLRVRGKASRHVKVILRTGSPTSLVELKRVAFDSAFSIIVVGDESSEEKQEGVDLRVIKTLMLLAANREWRGAPPKMVAEIMEKDHLQAAESAAAGQVSIVCSSKIISKVTVQTSRQPGFSRVYSELFGFAGNEIYIRSFPGCAGRRFDSLRACFPNAIPIGVSRQRLEGTRQVFVPVLNPGAEYVVQPDEWIICIARDDEIGFEPRDLAPVATSQVRTTAPPRSGQVLILGWNDQLYDILSEFDGSMTGPTPIVIAAAHPEEHAAALLREHLPRPLVHGVVKYHRLDYSRQSALARLPIGELDHLIILADESSGEPDPDSRTIMTVLSLRTLQPAVPADVRVVAEVVDSDNCELLSGERRLDFVVSPEIVSMLLTQLSQQLMLKAIYEDLLSAGGNEIYLRPAADYTHQRERCTFEELADAASSRRELAIGYLLASDAGEGDGVHLNPSRGASLALTGDDRVIVIAAA
jgi:hypothetical protein